ncbi:putative MFS alpha-glucoside transporter [Elsinoe ampelina]|uniref:Putative MFS alpha-glucoside transporter n=1 Tax=Elsinoe ampelina TaxID=302913 RepID=A0A6A6GHV2_9PEZI|nr:putative MFS alpha-glucoside transporter [Elsinoe ampelina]
MAPAVHNEKEAVAPEVMPDHPDNLDSVKANAFLISGAKNATDKEHKMTLWQGIKLYPKAIGWSVLISTCIAMEGYDISLLSNFYAFPQFNEKYGTLGPDGTYQISAPWQSGLSNGINVGEIIGLILNGWISERIGYRYTLMGSLVCLIAFISIYFTAQNVGALLAASILCGIPWGVFQTLTISYAADVCPVALRGYLTTYVNFCWGLGQAIGIGVIKSMLNREDEWAYRVPYALQWMWPLPLLIGVYFAPESPWWLVRNGRLDEAKKSLERLTTRKNDGTDEFNSDEAVSMMVHTNALENEITAGASYLDCFKGTDLRRTEIVCMVWAIQNLSGNNFSNFSTYFLQQAGVPTSTSYDFALGQYGINMAGVFGAWFLMSWGIGRRSLYLYGLCFLFIMLFVMGFLGLVPESNRKAGSLATGAMMLGWALSYQLTVGTVCYSLVAELPTRRLAVKTVVLGRAMYIVVAIISSTISPYMINPTAWDWGNYAGFFWAGSCALCIVYVFFRVPEPVGRTYAELDLLFDRKIPARQFHKTKVDAFDEGAEHIEQVNEKGTGV